MTTDTTSNGVDWPREFQQQALLEGWDVWDSDGSEDGPFQIQFLAEPELLDLGYTEPKFDSDDTNVWVHVREQALVHHSPLHQRALLFIEHNNTLEYARIMMWPMHIEATTHDGVRDSITGNDIALNFPDIFPRGRCDGCGLGLTENTIHDEEACVRAEAERTGHPLSDYGR